MMWLDVIWWVLLPAYGLWSLVSLRRSMLDALDRERALKRAVVDMYEAMGSMPDFERGEDIPVALLAPYMESLHATAKRVNEEVTALYE